MIGAILLAALVGLPSPEIPLPDPSQWAQSGPVSLTASRGQVVLIRFFTDPSCPYCSATAPALNEFHREFGKQGLLVIGIYTPKPDPAPVSVEDVRRVVRRYGFEFPVAIDPDWAALHALWLDRTPKAKFTSASILIDRRGIVRHVQEGGAYARDGSDPQARADYRAMRDAIKVLLAETN